MSKAVVFGCCLGLVVGGFIVGSSVSRDLQKKLSDCENTAQHQLKDTKYELEAANIKRKALVDAMFNNTVKNSINGEIREWIGESTAYLATYGLALGSECQEYTAVLELQLRQDVQKGSGLLAIIKRNSVIPESAAKELSETVNKQIEIIESYLE